MPASQVTGPLLPSLSIACDMSGVSPPRVFIAGDFAPCPRAIAPPVSALAARNPAFAKLEAMEHVHSRAWVQDKKVTVLEQAEAAYQETQFRLHEF